MGDRRGLTELARDAGFGAEELADVFRARIEPDEIEVVGYSAARWATFR
jgi:hypothetical protein